MDVETKAVLKQCVRSRAALAELRLAGQLIPDQSVLINTIPLLEAKDSSEIENIVTTNDALFREASELDDGGDPAAKEALRYRTALDSGFHALKERPLTARTAIEVCSIIKGVEMDVRRTPGTQLKNTFTGEVIYTPPDGADRIRDMLANWERYLHADDDIDPLIRMAVLHYQFEAIHPFLDGNGRTGRILNMLVLVQAGLLNHADALPQPAYPAHQSRLLPALAADYARPRLGALDTLHADRRGDDGDLDQPANPGDARA